MIFHNQKYYVIIEYKNIDREANYRYIFKIPEEEWIK